MLVLHSLLAAAFSVSLGLPSQAASGHPATDDAPKITIVSDSPAWRQRIEWGLDRFQSAGLMLPPTTITIHEEQAPCGGNSGRFRPRQPVEVHICSPSLAASRAARLITLHELAHAWAETQLTAGERDALLHLRGLEAWFDRRIPAYEWGAEHAAEVVSWGLMDEPIPIIRIDDAEPAALAAAFDLLVHRPPLWATDDKPGKP